MRPLARILALVAASLLLASASLASDWQSIEKLPGQSRVTVMVEGRPRNYFRVTPKSPLVVPIKGRTRLRVVSRVEQPPDSKQAVSYHLRVTEGKVLLGHQDAEGPVSAEAHVSHASYALGESRQLIVNVRKGSHRLTVSAEGAPGVLVRLLQAAPSARKEATVSLTPVEAPRSVSLVDGEKMARYYSALPGKPVRLRVVGPTTLDLVTRLDFDSTMRGTQSYRLGISEGDRRLREAEVKTTKALMATYSNLPDRVPSKFRRLRVMIGEGLHEISVELLRPPNGSVEVQARIPQQSVGNAE